MNVNIEDEWGEHPPVRFNDDGTITDTQLEIVNLKMNRQWEPVDVYFCFSKIFVIGSVSGTQLRNRFLFATVVLDVIFRDSLDVIF